MNKITKLTAAIAVAAAAIVVPTVTSTTPIVSADSNTTDFEGFTLGNVNGQDGWEKIGPFDVEVVDASATHPSLGSRSLRISNAVISGSFGDQTFSKPLAEAAGETTALSGGESSAPSHKFFEAEWSFASATPAAEQPGLSVVASPDRGDGARMSWVQMADTPDGLDVNFYDYVDSTDDSTCNGTFVFANVADGLARDQVHTIRVVMELEEGRGNDVVDVYVNGVLAHTGTSWEDYFRDGCDPVPAGARTVDSMLFRVAGAAAPATAGAGFLVDDVELSSSSPAPCTTECYVDAAAGSITNGGTGPTDALKDIQAGIDRVDAGGTVFVAAGTYPESLDINKALTLDGAGPDVVTIDASAFNDYSIDVRSNDVSLDGFTLTGNPTFSSAYGIKIAGPVPTRISNITVEDVVVNNSRRTGVDLNGVDGAVIRDVEVNDVVSGNGLSTTDSNDILFENITTNNNPWGGIALYTSGQFFGPAGSDNITIQGTNSFGEPNKVYVQVANVADPLNPAPVTNLTVEGFDYTVKNDTFRAGGENFTFYQVTQSDAITFATALLTFPGGLPAAADSYVNEIATGEFWVGTVGGVDMTIQAAVDAADPGDTINVLPGIYEANTTVDEHVRIIGAGSGPNGAVNTILRKNTNTDVIRITASGASAADPILLQDLRIEPVGVYGINVPGPTPVQFLELDNVDVIGSSTSAAIENAVGLKVATTASLSDVVITDSAFDRLDYGWYFAKALNEPASPGESNVANIEVTSTSFSSNQAKGIYVEKLSDANFDDVTVVDNGLDTTFFNAQWNAGFDINLKGQETYENISITNSTFEGNGLGVANGAAIMVKARDDAPSYTGDPAALDGLTITGNEITGNERGIRFGEPGKDNATPTGVSVTGNDITGNDEGGVINETLASVSAVENWWGDASGPSGEGPGTGDSVSPDVVVCPWLDDVAGTGNLVLDDCAGTGTLDVTKTVVWNDTEPDPAQTFEICIEGPTHPTADCQLADFDGETLTWTDLYPGDYVVTETDPGTDWTVEIVGSPVTVVEGSPSAPASVTNTNIVPVAADEPPTFESVPDDIAVSTAPGETGVVVEFDLPVATDDDTENPPTVVCDPASGTAFEVGDTTVTCTATDSGDQTAEVTFTVTVTATAASDLVAIDPARLLETRTGENLTTIDGEEVGVGRSSADTFLDVPIAGRGGVPADAIGAVLNVAAIQPDAAGFVTLYPCTDEIPTAASLNYEAGVNISNATFVDLSDDGDVCLFTSNVADYTIDVVGYLPAESRLGLVEPARFLETRDVDGLITIDGESEGDGVVTGDTFVEVQITGRDNVPDGAVAAMVNVAAVQPTANGFLTLYPCTDEVPLAASLNYTPGTNISNATMVELSATGTLCVYASSTTHVTLDVVGFAPPGTDVGTVEPARLLETRQGDDKATIDGEEEGAGISMTDSFLEVQIAGRAGVPATADSVILNLAAVQPLGVGFATLYPCTDDVPLAASINYTAGVNISNATLVDLSDDGTVCVYTSTPTHLTLDVLGYVNTSVDDAT
jgi:hypothetical protein